MIDRLMQLTGLWRIPAALMKPPEGWHGADFASRYQLWDHWEKAVKSVVYNFRGGLFVDVGANIGYYTLMAARNGNRVIAMEPDPDAFKALEKNVHYAGVGRLVDLYNAAAWSENATLHLMKGKHSDITQVGLGEGAPVLGLALDGLLAGRVPGLVKLDVEGSEPDVLRGMKSTLASRRTRVIFEALTKEKLAACKFQLRRLYVEKLDGTNYLAS